VFIRRVSLVALYDRLYLLVWSVLGWSFHSYTCLTPTEAHQKMSDSAQISITALMNKLMSLKIADSPTRHAFLISFQDLCNRYDQLADTTLDNSFKRTLLQASIVHDTALLNSWNTVNEVKRAQNPGMPVTVTYSEYFSLLINQSKTHDLAIPFKKGTRHAHKANFDSFSDGNDEENNDDDSVLDELLIC
jgi:hypothetical protein